MSAHSAHDVETAAEDYFARPVSQLTREELEHEVQVRRNVNGGDHSCQLLASRLIAAEHERNQLREENHRLANQVDSQWRQSQELKRVLEAVWRQLGFEASFPHLERCVFDRIAHLMRCESVLRAVAATVKEATP